MCKRFPEEEEQENYSQDEAQYEHMPKIIGAELSGKYDFSAKRLEEFLLQSRRIRSFKNLKEVILYPIWIIHLRSILYLLNSMPESR
jgi:hypothetical protein